MNTLLTLLFTLLAIPSQYRMMVISDPHVLDQSLFDVNSASMQAKMASDLNQNEYAQAAFNQLIDKALTDKPDVVLIPGDMTMNGSRVSHDAVAAQLHRLTDANIKVCLIPGENDINNSNAAAYLGATPQSVPSISGVEFDSIYAFTKQAFPNRRDDPNSHSYVLTLAPRLTLIGADCTVGSYSDDAGVFNESTLYWILQQADSAKAKGDRVIAMMHYQLLEHTDYMGNVVPQALVSNFETIATVFRLHGIELVFTGHMHINNVTTNFIQGNSIVEITSGTPCMYTNSYRMITASDTWNQFQCETQYITSIANNSSFTTAKNKSHLETAFQNTTLRGVYDMAWDNRAKLDSIIDDVAKSNDETTKQVYNIFNSIVDVKELCHNLINEIPSDSQERANYINGYVGKDITKAFIIHCNGNEGNQDTDGLSDDIIDDIADLLQALVKKHYTGFINTTRGLLITGIATAKPIIKNVEKVQDFFDGFFGDYTHYKQDDQNRTDDLTPTLQFAQLRPRDYYATVTFDLNGFGDNFVQKVLINDPNKITRPDDPTADGMYFVNWYSDPELTQLYDFNTEIISDDDVAITLYAKFIPVITFTLGDVKKMYDGTPIAPLYKYKGSLPKDCKEQVEVDTIITNVDSVTYRVSKTTIWNGDNDVTANYKIEWSQDAASMVITPRAIAITTGSASGIYNGVALTSNDTTMSGDGFVEGEGIDITYTGTQTLVGTSNNTITYTAQEGTLLDNYTITVTPGTLTITKRPITIISASDSVEYDGYPLTAESVEYIGEFAEGEGVTISYTGEQTEPGTSENEFSYEALEGTDLNNYEITTIFGTLIVTKESTTPTILVSPSVAEQVEKVIINETLYIRKGGVLYDATGKTLNQ